MNECKGRAKEEDREYETDSIHSFNLEFTHFFKPRIFLLLFFRSEYKKVIIKL